MGVGCESMGVSRNVSGSGTSDSARCLPKRWTALAHPCASRHSCIHAHHQSDRTGAGQLPGETCPFDQMRGNDAVNNTRYLAHYRRTAGKQKTQRIREAEYSLPHRLVGQHCIHQQRHAFGNCSCIALAPASPQSSAMRRAPQLGQNPRCLQLNATSASTWQVSQRTRRKPCSIRPHLR